jgi:hypothetical protein
MRTFWVGTYKWWEPKVGVFVYSTYVGIVSEPLIEFIINWQPQNKLTMVETASVIMFRLGYVLTPLCQGFVMRAFDFLILIY